MWEACWDEAAPAAGRHVSEFSGPNAKQNQNTGHPDAWLVASVRHATLDLRAVSSSLTLRMEPT